MPSPASTTINDRSLAKSRVLKAIIHDDGGRIGALDRLGARRAVSRDHGGRDLGEQQRLVSDVRRAIARLDLGRS